MMKLSGAALYTLMCCNFTNAQVTPDGSLGTEVQQNGNTIEITGGSTAGNNLFHSFQDFSPAELDVFFNNIDSIENIISRVTGANASFINGILKANGFANVILLNPNGITFGANATLDIGGAFVGSTAPELVFEDGTVLSTNPNSPVNLTISVPLGLQWNGTENPAKIIVDGARLEVKPGQVLVLMGGDVEVKGNGVKFEETEVTDKLDENGKPTEITKDIVENQQGLVAPGGRIELGGLKGAGLIEFSVDKNGNFVFPSGVERGNVAISNGAHIQVWSEGGGDINIYAANLTIEGTPRAETLITAGIAPGKGSPTAQAGKLNINATETITLDGKNGRVRVSNTVGYQDREIAEGQAGNLEITTRDLSLKNLAVMRTQSFGNGDSGDLLINASDTVLIDGKNEQGIVPGLLSNTVLSDSKIRSNAGNIEINTGKLEVLNAGRINANTARVGDAGNITINATENILLQNGPEITTSIELTGEGKGGDIKINTPLLELINRGAIISRTVGIGNGGDIIINATNNGEGKVIVNGYGNGLPSTINAEAGLFDPNKENNREGDGGNIEITTDSLVVLNGGKINAITSKTYGNAGNITINARENLIVQGEEFVPNLVTKKFDIVSSSITTASQKTSERNAGTIEINTRALEILDGGDINARTFSIGNGGKIIINAKDSVVIDGVRSDGSKSRIESASEIGSIGSKGDAGIITINTANLRISNNGYINVTTKTSGNAGTITINASDNVLVDGKNTDEDRSSILSIVDENATGNGGNIKINAGSLLVTNGGVINTNTAGKGNAGTINIETTGNVSITNNGSISSNSEQTSKAPQESTSESKKEASGNAGIITINTANLRISNNGLINTSTKTSGNAGTITINASDNVLVDGKNTDEDRSSILSLVDENATGNGKNIEINAGSLLVTNGGVINTNTAGEGNAGKIDIKTRGNVSITNNGRISSNSEQTSTASQGGDIIIKAGDDLIVEKNGSISTDSRSSNGGDITLDVVDILSLDEGEISAAAEKTGQGNGGSIIIKTGVLFLLENSQINANGPGKGGTIDIKASSGIYNICGEKCIDASGGTQEDTGTVVITSQDTHIQVDTQQQQQQVATSENVVTQSCGKRVGRRRNKGAVLAIVGREGLPPRPTDTLNVEVLVPFDTSTTAAQTLSEVKTETETETETHPQYPPAARSWYVNDQGITVFTALPIVPTGDYVPGFPQCH